MTSLKTINTFLYIKNKNKVFTLRKNKNQVFTLRNKLKIKTQNEYQRKPIRENRES